MLYLLIIIFIVQKNNLNLLRGVRILVVIEKGNDYYNENGDDFKVYVYLGLCVLYYFYFY